MKKVLYLAELKLGGKFGGSMCEDRNLKILKSCFEVQEVGVYAEGRDIKHKLVDLFTSKVPTLYSKSEVRKIENIILKSDAEIIFIETSKMGYFAKFAKNCGKKVVSFLHNCEYILYGTSRGKIYVPFIKKQEKLTLKYSDVLIYLNERDRETFSKLYGQITKNKEYRIVPITLDDYLTNDDLQALKNKDIDKTNGLFFGSNFPPNYNGIKWFIENVAEHINATINVVGLNFEHCRKELTRKNVNIVGTVDDLKHYIIDAGFIISPIFEGSGMKVKTCEALMYGKKIFATKEALEGYVDSNAINRCDTKEEFIQKINEYITSDETPYVEEVRKLYLNNYSNDSARKIIEELINSI